MIDRMARIAEDDLASGELSTPFGPFYVVASRDGVIHADWNGFLAKGAGELSTRQTNGGQARAMIEWAFAELEEYFVGKRVSFTVPVRVSGTPFQEAVWAALMEIPYGETRSYRDIALAVGSPKAVRAVGQANRANRVAVIIPCHRVIGQSGKLVGYAGSAVHLKAGLLEIERTVKI